MTLEFELLEGAQKIARILGVIDPHVHGFRRLDAVLKACQVCVKRIDNQIYSLNHLHIQNVLQSDTLEQTSQEFESIRQELIVIRDKVGNKPYV